MRSGGPCAPPPVMRNGPWTERFADAVSRYRHQDELDALIQEWALKQDKMEVMRLLQEAGVPAAAVLNEAEVYENPHLKARDFFLSLKHSVIGAHVYTGFAWKFGKTPSTARLAPNALGEHSDQVYGRLLGMGPGGDRGPGERSYHRPRVPSGRRTGPRGPLTVGVDALMSCTGNTLTNCHSYENSCQPFLSLRASPRAWQSGGGVDPAPRLPRPPQAGSQ